MELWFHSFGGIIPFLANIVATVSLVSFYTIGLCYHYCGGIIPLYANIIAIVFPLLFISDGMLLPSSGIIPFLAYIIISLSSLSLSGVYYHSFGTYIWLYINIS